MPPFRPTDEQRRSVERMAAVGIKHSDICKVIINPRTNKPLDEKVMRKHFRHELDAGYVKANTAVAQSLYDQAVKAGNVAAAIWWTKARMGWSETNKLLHATDGKPVAPVINLLGHPDEPTDGND
jgi:hypothetical protein